MIVCNTASFYLYSGTVGWTGSDQFCAFYPEDMPEDWKLAYYNTQFRCVYLPVNIWAHFKEADISVLHDETRDGFRFVLGRSTENDKIININNLSDKFVAEDEVDLCWLNQTVTMRELAGRMQSAIKTGHPLYLISHDYDWALLRQVNELIEVLGG